MKLRWLIALHFLVSTGVAHSEALGTAQVDRPSLDFAVGFRGFGRSFGPTDGTRTVGAWSGSGLGMAAEGSWYPAASLATGFLGNLGLCGEGQTSLGLQTEYGGDVYATRSSLLRGGLAWRALAGPHQLLVTAGVGYQYFGVASEATRGAARPALYDVGYLGPRLALGYGLALTSAFSLRVRAGFTMTLSRGELEQVAFPNAVAFGFDAQLDASLTVLPGLQLRAAVDASQVFLSLDAVHRAGDSTLGGSLALAVAL
jgi:hypothetical protein